MRESLATLFTLGALSISQAAVAGSVDQPQYPTLLQKYGDARPPFEVPGVDYYVGVPEDTFLIDPTKRGNLPSCASYDRATHVVTVTASHCVLDSLNFRAGGGLQLAIPHGIVHTVVKNSVFGLYDNPSFSTALIDFRGQTLTVENSTFSGVGQDPAYFDTGASGTVTFTHDYFFDLSGDALDFGSNEKVIVQYNAFVKIGMDPESHPDAVQFCGGKLDPASHESYNLLFQPVGVANTGNEGIQVSVQCGGTIEGYSADHNTIVAQHPKQMTMSYSIERRK